MQMPAALLPLSIILELIFGSPPGICGPRMPCRKLSRRHIGPFIIDRQINEVTFLRAAKRFAIVAQCSFTSLLNIYLTFTLCCLSSKI